MSNIDTSRHASIVKPWEHTQKICIIGAGATGSRIFLALVELGFTNIDVFDFDYVEPHNLANQAFMFEDLGSAKVDGLARIYKAKTGCEPPPEMRFINTRVPDEKFPLSGIVFLLTDTMSSRREIFDTSLQKNPDVEFVIETRMASSYGNIFSFNPNNFLKNKAWLATLIDDADAEVSACGTSISVGMTASLIANYAVWQMIHHMTEPSCSAEQINVFFKPFITATIDKL